MESGWALTAEPSCGSVNEAKLALPPFSKPCELVEPIEAIDPDDVPVTLTDKLLGFPLPSKVLSTVEPGWYHL
jgi:hypothetical protein